MEPTEKTLKSSGRSSSVINLQRQVKGPRTSTFKLMSGAKEKEKEREKEMDKLRVGFHENDRVNR